MLFAGCTKLNLISLPESVAFIGFGAFAECSSLTSISMPPSVVSIGFGAFAECKNLISIDIPASVTSIGFGVFEGCSQLTSINVDENNMKYRSIDGVLFNKAATTLIHYPIQKTNTNYVIPASVNSIIKGAIAKCKNLVFLDVDPGNENYRSIDGVLFNKDVTTLIQYPIKKEDSSYAMPTTVTKIGFDAFSECQNLTSIKIPTSVNLIEKAAFMRCEKLSSVTIPNSVSRVCPQAFKECTDLKSITLPSSVIEIGSYAFQHCKNLTSVSYFGLEDPGAKSIKIFDRCTKLNKIDLSKNYKNIKFCGISVVCKE